MKQPNPLKSKKSGTSKRKKVLLATLIPIGTVVVGGTTTFFCVTASLPKYLSLEYLYDSVEAKSKTSVDSIIFNVSAPNVDWGPYLSFFQQPGMINEPLVILSEQKNEAESYVIFIRHYAIYPSDSITFTIESPSSTGDIDKPFFTVKKENEQITFIYNVTGGGTKLINKTDVWFPSFDSRATITYNTSSLKLSRPLDDFVVSYVNPNIPNIAKIDSLGNPQSYKRLIYFRTTDFFLP